MFLVNCKFRSNSKQDIFILANYLRRLSNSQIPCQCYGSTAENSLPKEGSKVGSMPPLPLQPLEQMFAKYIKSVKPFVDVSQLNNTKELVQKFCEDENVGKKLQNLLQERALNMQNWLSDWWLSTAYLEFRKPVIVYSSPGLVWPKKKFNSLYDQLKYAAYLIVAALEFNKFIENDSLPQETLGNGHPLCMSQYKKIFGTCRIPKLNKDKLLFQDPENPSTNIIVMYNNHFFNFPAFEENTRIPLTENHFFGMLLQIVKEGENQSGPAVGVLTTEHRDTWAKIYEELKKNKSNKHILENYIEKALFIVCLDKPLPLGSGYNYDTRCSKLLLHGFGMRGSAANRWFDKTIQFVVGAEEDGTGISYEHSPAEGGPIGVLTDYVVKKLANLAILTVPDNCPNPKKLEFQLTDSINEAIQSAGDAVDKISNDLDVYSFCFKHFGKNVLKNMGVSPDSFIQIAIQLAFFKVHKCNAAQYESGSLRRYADGRTDTIRSCSEEVAEFCRIMTDRQSNIYNKADILKTALAAHKRYVNDVTEGRGVDRHLLGLKILARQHNIQDLQIFSDVAYQRSTHFRLSTSNVPTSCNGFMVYGPLVDDGYACCYNPLPHSINFGMSAWSTCADTYLTPFKNALEDSLFSMLRCLDNSALSKL